MKEDKFSLQGPFISELYDGLKKYLQDSRRKDLDLENWRKKLLKDEELLEIEDFGAGSKKLKKNQFRKTKDVTRFSTTGRKFNQIYQYFCLLSPGINVLELGTCTGLNTLYLSRVSKGSLFTFEGALGLINKAQQAPGVDRVHYIHGNIQDTLPPILEQIKKVDFALVDATHTYEGTMAYFNTLLPYLHEESIVAIADIHWSKEMELAWKKIYQQECVSLSIDFFECGILIFKRGIEKAHYILDI
ncbi:class I SAM-dependent methyltransferase [Cecembia rubra]|uniref:class I SAM-dependent methyltransferase n=1 Tax=Cecembia rubra TaxID=1485585 RepID=UPI002714ADD1|nr:class I SAM-dependent methyltransferase [Cecembia rubra]